MTLDVLGGLAEQRGIVLEVPEAGVATVTEERPVLPAGVAVIEGKRLGGAVAPLRFRLTAQGAEATLGIVHPAVIIGGDAKTVTHSTRKRVLAGSLRVLPAVSGGGGLMARPTPRLASIAGMFANAELFRRLLDAARSAYLHVVGYVGPQSVAVSAFVGHRLTLDISAIGARSSGYPGRFVTAALA